MDCEQSADEKVPGLLLTVFFEPEEERSAGSVLIRVQAFEEGKLKLQMESTALREDRLETKNELKRLLYRLLQTLTGKSLPWGDLTGIRPVKIPRDLLKEGWKQEETIGYMQETFCTSREKAELATDIASRENALLGKMDLFRRKETNPVLQNGYSLYVGIPFCPSICLYCSFSSSPLSLWEDQVDAYLDALCREIDAVSAMLQDSRPDTVYIGGGTPTTLTPQQMDRLLTKLEECFDLRQVREFTVEAGRPDTITREKLEVLCRHGISRISINPQTMNQATLDFIGRKHTTEQIREAFALARSLGFDNINMDMIVGLPKEGLPEVEQTLQALLALSPEEITVHSLAVKRAAKLRLFREEHTELTFENSEKIMNRTAACAKEAGMYPYYLYRQKNMAGNFENVGYAKPGCEGLYNILIMEEIQTILALGAGASTKLVYPDHRIERVENVKDIRNYMDRIDEMIQRKQTGLNAQEEKL